MQWAPFPLPTGTYADATRPWSQQDVVGYLPVPAEAGGTRSELKLTTVPGLRQFARVGDGPFRGSRDVEGKFFAVSGRKLYQVAVDGTATELGTIPGTALVSMTHNQIAGGNEVLIGTNDNSYLWNTVTEALTATGIPLFSVDFLNQRFLGIDPARRFWRYSALADGTDWNDLDNESAESSPDRIVGGKVCNGEWYVFGERTIEVWANSPTSTTAFQRVQVIEKGCANANTIVRMFNTLFFVGDDGIPYMLSGYTPQAIAPKPIIQAISSGDPRKLFAHTWEDDGHAVYYITAQDGQTFGYDVTTQRWHRRESFGLDRWRVNTLTKWRGEWYAGDYTTNQLYTLEKGYVYEGCEIMPRKITTGVLHNHGNRVKVHGLRLTVATGGEPSVPECAEAPPTITRWVAAGGSTGGTYIASDADTWDAYYGSRWQGVRFIGNRVVLFGTASTAYSDDFLATAPTLTTPPWGASTVTGWAQADSGRVYAVCGDDNLYYTDDGAAWVTAATGFTTCFDVACDGDAVMVRTAATKYRIASSGLTFGSEQTAPLSMSCISGGGGMFVATGSFSDFNRLPTPYTTWASTTLPAPGGDKIESYRWFRTSTGAWLGMNRESLNTTTTLIARSADGLSAFEYVTTPAANADGGSGDCFAEADGIILALCANSLGYQEILKSVDDGEEWASVSTASIPTATVHRKASIAGTIQA